MRKLLLIIAPFIIISCSGRDERSDASGTFEATEVIVSAEANGRITGSTFDEGMEVVAGNVIGYIDSTQLYLKRSQLLLNVSALGKRRIDVGKQIAVLDERISAQNYELSRMERLLAAGAGNQKQVDDIKASIAVLERERDAQKLSLENSNASLSDEQKALEIQVAQIDDQLMKCRITSPVTGTILSKYADEGEFAATGKALFKVANLEVMTLRAYITAAQLTELKLGQSVRVLSDFGDSGNREYNGTVTWISDKSEFTPKTIQTKDERANLVYAIKVTVVNDGYLKIGMYGDIIF
jgi:HlyD family secretion protein